VLLLSLAAAGCAADHGRSDEISAEVVPAEAVTDHDPGALERRVDRRHVLIVDGNADRVRQAIRALGGRVASWHGPTGVVVVEDLGADGAARAAALAGVRALGRDTIVSVDEGETRVPVVVHDGGSDDPDPGAAAAFDRQWHLRVIRADEGWAAWHVGSPEVTVAVLDTGLDYEHPDLAGRVDLSRSASFGPSDDALVAERFPGRHPVTDLHYHGTHVGATVSSNAVVAAGVTSEVTLVGVKVLGVDGRGSTSGVLEGVLHATDAGADVINMSLGGGFVPAEAPGLVQVIETTFAYAADHGVTVVASAGNDTLDMDEDGGRYNTYCDAPGVVCVSATGPEDDFAPYSNFGKTVDLAAPGGSTEGVWAACSETSLRIDSCRAEPGSIVGLAGTSMASPHVAGLAALLVANHGSDPAHVRLVMETFAEDLGEPGFDPRHGVGRIDVAAALGLDAAGRIREREWPPSTGALPAP